MARRFGITTPISTYPSMVLGSSEVRLIELTRAFASVGNRGVAVMPYAIRKVTNADGQLLYQHDASEQRELVAPYVAAEMTDLMQTAVLSGTGRAAQIGRPVAGKTGTTTSNKDGWFVGFSSGLTTGVWMGRDDNRTVPGLQGGTAPARAFHDFMVVAVAKRPIEQFDTEAAIPDWASEPDDEMFNYVDDSPLVDADGNPIYRPGEQPGDPMAPGVSGARPGDQQWIDDVLNRPAPPPVQPGQQPLPGQPLPPPPQPQQPVTRDPLAPRSGQPNPAQVGGQPAQR
jgi:penicillin-binding protein 1A